MPPSHVAASSTHDRLLEAAAQVFARAGLKGATTRAIAEEAGVNEVTLFRHFQNKERLLAAVLERVGAAQAVALNDEGPWTGDLHEDLQHYAEVYNRVLESNEDLVRTVIGEARRYPDHARQLILEATRSSRERFVSYLSAAHSAGSIRADVDLRAAADAFTGMLLSGLLRRPAQPSAGYSAASYLRTCVELFVRGISAGIASAKPKGNRAA